MAAATIRAHNRAPLSAVVLIADDALAVVVVFRVGAVPVAVTRTDHLRAGGLIAASDAHKRTFALSAAFGTIVGR